MFDVQNPNWETRVRESFHAQRLMGVMGVELIRTEPGFARFEMPFHPDFTQQHGFLHAGAITTVVDSACGYAAMSLMPADGEVLTVEFKVNLMSPARGTRFIFEGRVIKPGRTLTFTEGTVEAEAEGKRKQIASMSATMMTLVGRADLAGSAASN